MAVVHLLPIDRFPLTKCGVDTQEKKGALFVPDNEEDWESKVTCNNCLKLIRGGQMGGPPPRPNPVQQEERRVEKQVSAYEDRISRLVGFRDRIATLITTGTFLAGESMAVEEVIAVGNCVEFLEAAKAQIGFAIGEIQILVEQNHKVEAEAEVE